MFTSVQKITPYPIQRLLETAIVSIKVIQLYASIVPYYRFVPNQKISKKSSLVIYGKMI